MLSRFAFRSVRLLPTTAQGGQVIRATGTKSDGKTPEPEVPNDLASKMDVIYFGKGSEFPYKIVPFQLKEERPDNIPPVRFGFVPYSWFTFFHPVTGVTGPYMFLVGVSTYLVSKEIYVLEHEYYNALTFLTMCGIAVAKFGPQLKNYLIKKQDEKIKLINDAIDLKKKSAKDIIQMETKKQESLEIHDIVIEARKQNVKIQLEASYREYLAQIHNDVKKRLDYHVKVQSAERRLAQKHMATWIVNNVLKAITPEQEKAALQQSLVDLRGLAKA